MSSLPVRGEKDQPRRKSASAAKVQSPSAAFGVRRFIGNVPFGIPLRKSALDNTSFRDLPQARGEIAVIEKLL